MTPDPVTVSTMYATWVQAGASLLTLFIALGAAFSWYETLRSQRSDECVGAAIYFQSCVGRYLSLKEGRFNVLEAYDEIWNAQAHLNQTLIVQKRYDDFAGWDYSEQSLKLIKEKIAPTVGDPTIDPKLAAGINGECKTMVDKIIDRMRPGVIMRGLAKTRVIVRDSPWRAHLRRRPVVPDVPPDDQ